MIKSHELPLLLILLCFSYASAVRYLFWLLGKTRKYAISSRVLVCHGARLKEMCLCVCSVMSNSFTTPWTVTHQDPLSMGFSGQEYWSGLPSTLATSCEELTRWKRLWCWEGLGAGGEGDNRGWDGWMASLTWWMWVSVNSGGWWWTGRPGMLRFMGSQRVGHDWATDLIWSDLQRIFLTSRLNLSLLRLLHCRQILYHCTIWVYTKEI